MLCRANQDRWGMVESPDKIWYTGEGNGKPPQYSCLKNPMTCMNMHLRFLHKCILLSEGAGVLTPGLAASGTQRFFRTERSTSGCTPVCHSTAFLGVEGAATLHPQGSVHREAPLVFFCVLRAHFLLGLHCLDEPQFIYPLTC